MPAEAISALIKPYPETDMTAYTNLKIANGSKNNRSVPEVLNEVEYPELPALQ